MYLYNNIYSELNNNLDLFSLPEEISDLIHLQVL